MIEDNYYDISVPDFGGLLRILISNKQEYEDTFNPIYYPDIPNYRAT